MGLSMMIPGLVAGYVQEALGYQNFFWMVMVCCLVTVFVTFFVYHKVDPNYGKNKQ
jgi:PAT family beta-lactamase induction signal transducer AmpG